MVACVMSRAVRAPMSMLRAVCAPMQRALLSAAVVLVVGCWVLVGLLLVCLSAIVRRSLVREVSGEW